MIHPCSSPSLSVCLSLSLLSLSPSLPPSLTCPPTHPHTLPSLNLPPPIPTPPPHLSLHLSASHTHISCWAVLKPPMRDAICAVVHVLGGHVFYGKDGPGCGRAGVLARPLCKGVATLSRARARCLSLSLELDGDVEARECSRVN